MKRAFRKGRVERTAFTALKLGEGFYAGANYRGGTLSVGVGAPTSLAVDGSSYVDTNTNTVYHFYQGAWH